MSLAFPSPPAIVASGLSKTYVLYDRAADRLKQFLWHGRKHFGREFHALSDVSFELPRGEVLGIVGRNGAGKSTLLQLICGTLQPSSGSLEVNGRVAALLELGAGFNPEFTGRENVLMNAALLGASEEEVREKFATIVEFAGLADFIDQPVKTYSSGMYIRLAFSVATAFEPDILVIDEALSVGDGAFARKSFDRIMALKEKGATILFCSHAMYHVDTLCERALWLDGGKAKMLDSAQKVTAEYNDFLAKDNPPPTAQAAPSPSPAAQAGTARILSVRTTVDGKPGDSLPVRSGRGELAVTVEFASDPALPSPSVAIAIVSHGGVVVTSSGTFMEGVELHRTPTGEGGAVLTFPALPLLKGRYTLRIFLACERGLHLYDHIDMAREFIVVQEGLAQGLISLPHTWNSMIAP